jgi:RHS repeat-associated protein
VTFKYDSLGRRVQKSSALGTTNYLHDGQNLLIETDQGGNTLARYTGADGTDEPVSLFRSGIASYYEWDALSSITSLSDSTGTLVNTYIYDSFGKPTGSTGTRLNPIRYAGRDFDAETGLIYYRARYYDPNIGRFVSQDPIGLRGGNNTYAYVRNRPTDLTDPSGLCEPKCFAQLKYRPARLGQNHAFWWVQDRSGQQHIVSGGPTGPVGTGYLNIWNDWGSTGTHFPTDNSGDTTAFASELSPEVCAKVDKLLRAANSYPNGTIEYYGQGPNSNSIAHYLGDAGGFNPPPPPDSLGWGTPVPVPPVPPGKL